MDTVYYAHILQCNDGKKYYGHTNDLRERLHDHAKGYVRAIRYKQPTLVYFEGLSLRSEAFRREMQFKNGNTRKESIGKLIKAFPLAKCQGFNSHSDLCSLSFHKSRAH